MSLMVKTTWLLCLLLAGCTWSAPPPPVDVFVADMLVAYGGRERLAALQTVAAHGRIDDYLRQSAGGYARLMRRPGGLRIEIIPERGGEVRILDNAQGWQGNASGLAPAKPMSLFSMRYQYAYLDLPMSLADGRATARDGGLVSDNGATLRLLLVETPGAPLLQVWVDPKSLLIRRVSADFDMGPLGRSELGTIYDDYRPVAGLLFPHRLTNLAGGRPISQLTLTTLQLDTDLPAETFAPR